MSFLKEIIENFSSIFSDSVQSQQNCSSTGAPAMDSEGGVSTGNERTAYKLKGYFDLAKEEIAKAVRAEEWGLPGDAVFHYQNAQRIHSEAISTPVPSYISSRCERVIYNADLVVFRFVNLMEDDFMPELAFLPEMLAAYKPCLNTISDYEDDCRSIEVLDFILDGLAVVNELEKVKSYRQKISKWQGQVAERLQTLARRTGGSSEIKSTSPKPQTGAISSTVSNPRKMAVQKSSGHSRGGPLLRSQANNATTPRPVKESGSGYDAKLVEMINSVIIDQSPSVKWEDIAGLEMAKQALLEMVILPTKRRDLLLDFEASQGQPSVIFIDEIDSIMSTRTENENEASRRLKSEFLVQFDGVTSSSGDLVTVIGATNKPQELDDAVLRRLVKRIYIPLPDTNARRILLKHKLKGHAFSLPDRDLERLVAETDGYSGSDLQALCEEAAMMPIRELGSNILTVQANQVRGLRCGDFQKAMTVIRPSLQKSKWEELEKWNREYGSN
ncbi:hypothetical protein DH2020_002249 [Rehmannia glutinosa]|uniref:Spastin n=1 Tax=Rehmannia glutinosa TaxID=99300 RepID=A0ABR0XT53_REHGL